MTNNKIAIVSGGTGGHVFPSLAVAQEVISRFGDDSCLWITDTRGVRYLQFAPRSIQNIKHLTLRINRFPKRHFIWHTIKCLPTVFRFLKANNISKILVFGGYPTLPALLIAKVMGIRIYTHEQNAVMGRVNKLACKLSKQVFSHMPVKNHQNTNVCGMPLFKDDFLVLKNSVTQNVISKKHDTTQGLIILVTGGSQGANILGSDVAKGIVASGIIVKKVFHQAPIKLHDDISAVYHQHNINHELVSFFPNHAKLVAISDLVISRSGAGTLSQLITTGGKNSILIPYPHAVHDHQLLNAQQYCQQYNGTILLEEDFTKLSLAEKIKQVLSNKKTKHNSVQTNPAELITNEIWRE